VKHLTVRELAARHQMLTRRQVAEQHEYVSAAGPLMALAARGEDGTSFGMTDSSNLVGLWAGVVYCC
jgi:hypothetical protein